MGDPVFPIVWRPSLNSMLKECLDTESYAKVNFKTEYMVKATVISPNPLQNQRFFPINDSIFVQISGSTEALLQDTKFIQDTTLMIRGPAGTGKSFALLHLILNLRKKSFDKTQTLEMPRFLYINNPTSLADNWHKYMIDELVYTMVPDIFLWENELRPYIITTQGDAQKPLLDYLEEKRDLSDELVVAELIKNYASFCKQKKLFFVLVIDQYNQFQQKLQILPEWFIKLPQNFSMRIYGRSDTSDRTGSVGDTELFLDMKFNLKQAIIYLDRKVPGISQRMVLPKEDDPDIEKNLDNYPEFKKLYDSTQFMPFELEVFTQVALQNATMDFHSTYEAFLNKRYGDVCEMNTKWLKNYAFLQRDDCARFVFNVNIGITDIRKLPSAFFNHDPNLFYKYTLDMETHIRFTSKVVEHCMYKIWSKEYNFWKIADETLYSNRDIIRKIINMHKSKNDSKGNMFQKYFEAMMRLGASLQLQNLPLAPNMADTFKLSFKDNQEIKSQISFTDIRKFIPFQDSELLDKLQSAIDSHEVAVLVPNSLSFAFADFIFVDSTKPDEIKMYVIQCTINICSHDKVDVWMDHQLNKLHALQKPVSEKVLKTNTEPISQCLFRIQEKDSKIKPVFLWVGLARPQDKEEYINQTDDLFVRFFVHRDSQVALLMDNQMMFQGLMIETV